MCIYTSPGIILNHQNLLIPLFYKSNYFHTFSAISHFVFELLSSVLHLYHENSPNSHFKYYKTYHYNSKIAKNINIKIILSYHFFWSKSHILFIKMKAQIISPTLHTPAVSRIHTPASYSPPGSPGTSPGYSLPCITPALPRWSADYPDNKPQTSCEVPVSHEPACTSDTDSRQMLQKTNPTLAAGCSWMNSGKSP